MPIRIFNTEVILLCATVLRMVAVLEPFYGISIITEGMLQGMGKTIFPFVCNLVGIWGIRIVGTFVGCSHFITCRENGERAQDNHIMRSLFVC